MEKSVGESKTVQSLKTLYGKDPDKTIASSLITFAYAKILLNSPDMEWAGFCENKIAAFSKVSQRERDAFNAKWQALRSNPPNTKAAGLSAAQIEKKKAELDKVRRRQADLVEALKTAGVEA